MQGQQKFWTKIWISSEYICFSKNILISKINNSKNNSKNIIILSHTISGSRESWVSTIVFEDNIVYDWHNEHGIIAFHLPNAEKTVF